MMRKLSLLLMPTAPDSCASSLSNEVTEITLLRGQNLGLPIGTNREHKSWHSHQRLLDWRYRLFRF